MIHKTLLDSPKYKAFTQDRNKALEMINIHCQTDVSRMLHESLDRITGFVSHMALQDTMTVYQLSYLSNQVDQYITHQFHPLAVQIERRLIRMRKNTFTLTYMAELEAVARATMKTKSMTSIEFSHKLRGQLNQDLILGYPWGKRIWIVLTQLRFKILKAFAIAIVREDSPKEIVDSIQKSYPKIIGYKVPPRALKKVREADRPKNDDEDQEFNFYGDIVTQDDWDLAVQAYKDTELPASRFDSDGAKRDPELGYFRYDWELEQDMTDDFVNQVREGQVEAANELGVKDFVWVSVIDKKTCDTCCLPRNGKTVSEIEAMLKTGELDKEECDATAPPAHPYCRCDLAPVSSTDEVEGPNWKEFQDWLNS